MNFTWNSINMNSTWKNICLCTWLILLILFTFNSLALKCDGGWVGSVWYRVLSKLLQYVLLERLQPFLITTTYTSKCKIMFLKTIKNNRGCMKKKRYEELDLLFLPTWPKISASTYFPFFAAFDSTPLLTPSMIDVVCHGRTEFKSLT